MNAPAVFVPPADLSVFRIQDGETHWVIASSEREALEILQTQGMFDDYDSIEAYLAEEEPAIIELEDDTTLPMRVEDDGTKETHTAGGWCAIQGKGLLGSTAC